MKYFENPVYDSKFMQFIDLFADLIEKYGGDMDFPDGKSKGWENDSETVHSENSKSILTKPEAA